MRKPSTHKTALNILSNLGKIDLIIASFGKLNIDSIRLSDIARHRKAANLLVDKVQFNR